MKELSRRLPRGLRRQEIETATRLVEIVLDGMIIGLAVNRTPKALSLTTLAWNRFLDLLLRDLGAV